MGNGPKKSFFDVLRQKTAPLMTRPESILNTEKPATVSTEKNTPVSGNDSTGDKFYKIAALVLFALLILLASAYWYSFASRNNGLPPEAQPEQLAGESPEIKAAPLKESYRAANTPSGAAQNEKITINEAEKLPDIKKFAAFFYDASSGKSTTISGACNDAYYAFLVFSTKDDYRKDPGAARVNRAFPCPENRVFKQEINFKEFNLLSGNYYFFIADQGKTGIWYNPR